MLSLIDLNILRATLNLHVQLLAKNGFTIMRTWNDYKEHVKSTDSTSKSDMEEIESYKTTPNLDTLLKIFNPLGLSLIVSK